MVNVICAFKMHWELQLSKQASYLFLYFKNVYEKNLNYFIFLL
jgi:hypothetical protein